MLLSHDGYPDMSFSVLPVSNTALYHVFILICFKEVRKFAKQKSFET